MSWVTSFLRWANGEVAVLDFEGQPIPHRVRELLEAAERGNALVMERVDGGWPPEASFPLSAGVMLRDCLCNVGVQECPVHPGRLRTKDEKIAFRKAWDAAVDEGRQSSNTD